VNKKRAEDLEKDTTFCENRWGKNSSQWWLSLNFATRRASFRSPRFIQRARNLAWNSSRSHPFAPKAGRHGDIGRGTRDPSLRLKDGSAQDDADGR